MEKDVRHNRIVHVIYFAAIFIGLFCYHFVAHPLVLADLDDWGGVAYWRRALPIYGSFNSIKVFPEVLFSFCSMIAVNVVYPIYKDYLMSLAFTFAIVGALFITIYIILVSRLIRKVCGISWKSTYAVSTIFLMLHYLMYKNEWTGNVHLLWSQNVVNYFQYLLMAIFSFYVVIQMMNYETVNNGSISEDIKSGKIGAFKAGLYLLTLYLAVFSNMFTNIALATYLGVHALLGLINTIKNNSDKKVKDNLSNWYNKHWFSLLGLAMWIAAVVLQISDTRNGIARSQGMKGSFSGALSVFVSNFTSVNKMAAVVVVLFIALFLLRNYRDRKYRKNNEIIIALSSEMLLSCILTALYLIILSGVSSPGYLSRCDVKIGIFFFILLESVLMLGWSVRPDTDSEDGKHTDGKLAIILPFICFVISLQAMNYCKSYRDFNINGFSYEDELRLSNDIISQFVEADKRGDNEVELHVVLNEGADDNWPYPWYSGEMIRDTLFRHGVISKNIENVTTVFDESKNEELNIHFK